MSFTGAGIRRGFPIAVVLVLSFLFVPRVLASSGEWSEVRGIDVPKGAIVRVDVGDTIRGASGPGVTGFEGRWMIVRSPADSLSVCHVQRETLGPLELRVRVVPSPTGIDPEVLREPVAHSSERPRRPPEIAVPPRSIPLRNPAGSGRLENQRPSRPERGMWPTVEEGRLDAPAKETVAQKIPEITVVERPLPPPPPPPDPIEGIAALGKPDEVAIFTLGSDLLARGLFGEAIIQFERLLTDFPRTKLRVPALKNIGTSNKSWGRELEKEALRQQDLRRSGSAIESIDQAVGRFQKAAAAFRDAMSLTKIPEEQREFQIEIAESVHGQVRALFQKGGTVQDSPVVVVEYLKAAVDADKSPETTARARLGIAQYFRDLGDARMLNRSDKELIRRAYTRAIEAYDDVAAFAPASRYAEEALYDLARLYDRNLEMRRFDLAVEKYESLISRFPSSRFGDEARNRSRYIRENYL